MEAIKNGLRKNLTPAQLWSGARFFLLLNLGLIIYAVALNFYRARQPLCIWRHYRSFHRSTMAFRL